ncbi:hypothetical protein BDZ94DRAFT_1219539 [Collybia nuda]|uniref:Uncharacterized protein n=1 Tax=Collybia nuda TaxID=64659 RepID=A0A9P5Y7L0_9AGAR|nr:hypothetical protein BDZ94DRAFT_1219539 [Collybia nuda]
MAWRLSILRLIYFLLTSWSYWSQVYAQTISIDTPVPPLQWINLSGLLKGSSRPPPLKDASVGYDETRHACNANRSLIIFGGESAGGFVLSQTYLLNLDTLTWSVPSPPSNLQRTPPARSAAVAGGDFAGSNRQGFVVIGGKGSDGQGLADIWASEYDFNNKFWSEVETPSPGPLPRWGASGGIDVLTAPTQDPVVPGPNNTFFLVGGSNGTQWNSLSDIWSLSIAGTLSSNLPDSSTASWNRLTAGNLPTKKFQTGTVISSRIVVAGGCDATLSSGFCAQQGAYVIDASRKSSISPGPCPAPRLRPVLVPNANKFSTSFGSQVYLLLGTIDSSRWQDDNGLNKGEVAVLDADTGLWTRILPSGDPGVTGEPTWPTPREGAAAFSHTKGLVGRLRDDFSDTIVFGGRDTSGNILSEVWLLRAYAGVVTPSSLVWAGFGTGELQTGIDANGSGVRVEYMTRCASVITSSSLSSIPTSANPTPTSTTGVKSPSASPFDTSLVHKVLSPLSVAIFQLAYLLIRLLSPSYLEDHILIHWVVTGVVLAAYALGVAGLAMAFTGITRTTGGHRNTADLHLKTGHAISGLILFIGVHGLIPVLLFIASRIRGSHHNPGGLVDDDSKPNIPVSSLSMEKAHPNSEAMRSPSQSFHDMSPPASPRPRTNSWGPSSIFRRSPDGRRSTDSESSSLGPHRGFEVVNRPTRARRASGGWPQPHSAENYSQQIAARSLGEIDWLQRRRTLNAVGELDYAISQVRRAQSSSTPATTDALMGSATRIALRRQLPFPPPPKIVLRLLVQLCLLGFSVLTLVILWQRAPRFAFGVFLTWTVAFYAVMSVCSWYFCPEHSILSALRSRLGTNTPETLDTPSTPTPGLRTPAGPYTHHQTPFRAAAISDDGSVAVRSVDTDVLEDGVDEFTTQRMIEEEMGRRDVSIITIPKRRLWIANPS